MSLQERDGERRLTVELAARSVSKVVRVLPGEDLAFIIKANGTSLLVRYAGSTNRRGQKHHYQTVSLDGVRLLDDPPFRVLQADWLSNAMDAAKRGGRVPSDIYAVVDRLLHPSTEVEPINQDEVYEVFRRHRGELLDGDTPTRAWLERVFEGYPQFEARWLEERELQADLDRQIASAKLARQAFDASLGKSDACELDNHELCHFLHCSCACHKAARS